MVQFLRPALRIVKTTRNSPLRSAKRRMRTAARRVRGHLYQLVVGLAKARRFAIALFGAFGSAYVLRVSMLGKFVPSTLAIDWPCSRHTKNVRSSNVQCFGVD